MHRGGSREREFPATIRNRLTTNGFRPPTVFSGRNYVAGVPPYNNDLNGDRNTGSNQVGADNQLTADANWTYRYNDAGQLIEKDGLSGGADPNITWKYGYDAEGRLTQMAETNTSTGALIAQENDVYDVMGNRVEEVQTQNGTTTVTKQAYDANGVCYADISGTGSIVTRRVNLDATDALFARITQAGGAVAWYLTDHLGSVTGLMNNSNTLIDGLVYDPFGNVTNETSPSNGDRYAFTGRERDVETGLQYNRARWYDPSTGRWITQDPLGFDAGDSNLYRYVNNQPTTLTDPKGLENFGYERDLGPRPKVWTPAELAAAGLGAISEVQSKIFKNRRPGDVEPAKKWLKENNLGSIEIKTKADFAKNTAPNELFKFVITPREKNHPNGVLRIIKHQPKVIHIMAADPVGADVGSAGWIKIGPERQIWYNTDSNHYRTTGDPAAKKLAEDNFRELDLDPAPVYKKGIQN